jgi:hypothetical protein
VYFFDTTDGLAPTDDDDDGTFENLTPPITIRDRAWSFRGFLYLNASSFQTSNVTGRATVFQAPGEPYLDLDRNGVFDPATEPWLNLVYPSTLAGGFRVVDGESTPTRAARGPDVADSAALHGILYTTGRFEATGAARHYGSVIAVSGVTQDAGDPGSPALYWDETIARGWPPAGTRLPRVTITRWSTDP